MWSPRGIGASSDLRGYLLNQRPAKLEQTPGLPGKDDASSLEQVSHWLAGSLGFLSEPGNLPLGWEP